MTGSAIALPLQGMVIARSVILNEPSCSHDADSQRGFADSACDPTQHYDSHVPELSCVR